MGEDKFEPNNENDIQEYFVDYKILSNAYKKLDDENKKLNDKNNELNDKNNELNDKNKNLNDKNNELNDKNNELNDKNNELKTEIKGLQQDVQGLRNELINLQTQLAAKEAELENLKSSSSDGGELLRAKESERKRLEKELAEVKAELENLKSSSSDGGELLRAKDSKIEQLGKAFSRARTQLLERNQLLDKKESELGQLKEMINELSSEKKKFTEKNAELTDQLHAAKQSKEPRYAIIWGFILTLITVIFNVVIIWLSVFRSLKIITPTTIVCALFLSITNIFLAMRIILNGIGDASRKKLIRIVCLVMWTGCLAVVFISTILAFGAGM